MIFSIGDKFKDTKVLDSKYFNKKDYTIIENSDIVEITNVSSNSVELLHLARTDKGVNAKQWHSIVEGPALKDFEKRFKKI